MRLATLCALVLVLGLGACTDHNNIAGTVLDNTGKPTDPLGPGNPGNPGDPGDPTDPGDPGNPGDPGQPVPEPMTMFLLGSGLAGAAIVGRRRKRAQES